MVLLLAVVAHETDAGAPVELVDGVAQRLQVGLACSPQRQRAEEEISIELSFFFLFGGELRHSGLGISRIDR